MAQVDSLKIIIEAEVQQAIAKLNQYDATQKKVTKGATDMAKSSKESADGFAKLRIGGEGLSIGGFAKVAGIAGAIALGLKAVYSAARDAEMAFEKLHPEMAKMDGSATQFNNAVLNLKSAMGSIVADGMRPMRAAISDIINGWADAINKMAEYKRLKIGLDSGTQGVMKQSELESYYYGLVGRYSAATGKISAYEKSGGYGVDMSKVKAERDAIMAEMQKIASQFRADSQLGLLASDIDKGNGVATSDMIWTRILSPDLNEALRIIKEKAEAGILVGDDIRKAMADAYQSILERAFGMGFSAAEFPETIKKFKEYLTNSGGLADIAFSLGSDMPEGKPVWNPNELRPNAIFDNGQTSIMMQEAIDQMDHLRGVTQETGASFDELFSSMDNLLAESTISGLFAIGEALGQGKSAGDAFTDMIQSMLSQLPQILLAAGLRAIASGFVEVGIALIVAAGFSALIGGAISGGLEAQQAAQMAGSSSGSYGGSGYTSSASYTPGAQAVTFINIYGNVWTEEDLAASLAARQGAW